LNPDIHGLVARAADPRQGQQRVDTPRAMAHAKRMLAAGCDGVTLFGTTGEGPAFTVAERKGLLEALLASGVRADQIWSPPAPVPLGDAIELGRHASSLGCHRQMFMPPFLLSPAQ
jgi:4-hydroxy-tetrahydrodipicolinate synthase